jgi:hypothetical protein
VTIDLNKRASITAVGGAEFEVNDDGMFPVEVTKAGGRRLLRFAGLAKAIIKGAKYIDAACSGSGRC